MTRPPGYFWRLVLIPLAILISLTCAGHALAGSIYVFDGFGRGSGIGSSFFIGGLIGERGLWYRPDLSGHATLDGKSYAVGEPLGSGSGFTPASNCPRGPSCAPPTSTLQISFLAPNDIAPPFSAAVCDPICSATLTAPFQLMGSFSYLGANNQTVVTDELVGNGIASPTLDLHSRQVSPCCVDTFWRYDSRGYDIQPTPEPATLLLVGTSAAGLGLVPVAEEAPPRGAEPPPGRSARGTGDRAAGGMHGSLGLREWRSERWSQDEGAT